MSIFRLQENYKVILLLSVLSVFLPACTAAKFSNRSAAIRSELFAPGYKEIGMATYYDDKFEGRTTTSGEIFTQNKVSAAHTQFPMGTKIKVVNKKNGRTLIVMVNDRMPANSKNRTLDVSKAGAVQLGMIADGVVAVEITILEIPQ